MLEIRLVSEASLLQGCGDSGRIALRCGRVDSIKEEDTNHLEKAADGRRIHLEG
jgi:hypothetical protein